MGVKCWPSVHEFHLPTIPVLQWNGDILCFFPFRLACLLISSCGSSLSWSSAWLDNVSFLRCVLVCVILHCLLRGVLDVCFSCGGMQWEWLSSSLFTGAAGSQCDVRIHLQRSGARWGKNISGWKVKGHYMTHQRLAPHIKLQKKHSLILSISLIYSNIASFSGSFYVKRLTK